MKYTFAILFLLPFTSIAKTDSLIRNLYRYNRVVIYSTNHNSLNLNNIQADLTVGIAQYSDTINLYFESAYLNVALTNELILKDLFPAATNNFLGNNLLFFDTVYLQRLFGLIRLRKINFKGYDCTGSNVLGIDILFDSTRRFFQQEYLDTSYLRSTYEFVRQIPSNWQYMVYYMLPEKDIKSLEKVYANVLNGHSSSFLKYSWESIYQFFEWLKCRPHDISIVSADCKKGAEIYKYRDSIMYMNYKALSDRKKDVIWIGSYHSQRRTFDLNIFGDKLIPYPSSFTDYLLKDNSEKSTARVLLTEESLILSKANSFTEKIGSDIVTVYYLSNLSKIETYYFKMKAFCQMPLKANWFKNFDYIVVVNRKSL